MRLLCSFVVPGEPVGKGRPRFTRTGRTFTPKKTVTAESMVALFARDAYRHEPTECPCMVDIVAHFAMPKSWGPRKRAEMLDKPCTKRPDGDNVAKLVCDSLNGLVWRDDAQVGDLIIRKRWAECSAVGIDIWVEEQA